MKEETLKTIKDNIAVAEKQIKELRTDIDKARKGGIDVTEQERTYLDLSKKLAQLKSAYL